jgi:uncharacterized membrane protein
VIVWVLFAALAAVFDATYYALVKRGVMHIGSRILAAGTFLFSAGILFSISAVRGFPEIGEWFALAVIGSASVNIIAAILYFRALRMTDLSLAMPMISFTPVFLIVTSALMLDEHPSMMGIVGIIGIVLGIYVLNMTTGSAGLLDPFRQLVREPGIIAMLGVAFLFALAGNFDKMVLQNSDPVFGSSFVLLIIGIFFLTVAILRPERGDGLCRKTLPLFAATGIALALSVIAINLALSLQIVPYVISIKRLSILITVMYGGLLLREQNFRMRTLGAIVMVGGAVLVILC